MLTPLDIITIRLIIREEIARMQGDKYDPDANGDHLGVPAFPVKIDNSSLYRAEDS